MADSTRMRLLAVLSLVASTALATTGDGSSGDRTIDAATTLNRYGVLRAPLAAGATTLETTEGLLDVGDLALLLTVQSTDALPTDGDTVRVDNSSVGLFEFVRVQAVAGGAVTLTGPVERAWPADVTQVVFVPQFASLTVTGQGVIDAPAWDGRTGGVVALAVRDRFTNDGRVQVDGRGFRGGPGGLASQPPQLPMTEVVRNGEGVVRGSWPMTRDVLPATSGGAIGHLFQAYSIAAGGGGGNATRGGRAPLAKDSAGGVGGLRVGSAGRRLVFGGGAAATAQGVHLFSDPGGSGGGAIIVFAGELRGAGVFSARGVAGATTEYEGTRRTSAGAGGSVVLDVVGPASCTTVDASGGEGQPVECCAASAAGGAGRIFVTAQSFSCATRAVSGVTGTVGGLPRDGWPTEPQPGEVDVREATRSATKGPAGLRFAVGCSAAPGVLGLLALVVVLRRRGGARGASRRLSRGPSHAR